MDGRQQPATDKNVMVPSVNYQRRLVKLQPRVKAQAVNSWRLSIEDLSVCSWSYGAGLGGLSQPNTLRRFFT
jgi:hypothetical protein